MESKDHGENVNVGSAEQPKTGLKPGDVTWIKLSRSAWWPAQVADEKVVSDSLKLRKGKRGEVLVRLYGTSDYSYVDPVKIQAEFEKVLKKHNGNKREIFEKALAKFMDLSESESSGSKKQSGRGKGKTKTENDSECKEVPAKRATGKQDEAKKKIKQDSTSTDMTPEKPSGTPRRVKVMQGLGLTPPDGSPYVKQGRILSIASVDEPSSVKDDEHSS